MNRLFETIGGIALIIMLVGILAQCTGIMGGGPFDMMGGSGGQPF